MLDATGCTVRRHHLMNALADKKLDAFVLTLPHHVQWLTGHRAHRLQQAAAVLTTNGQVTLVAAETPVFAVADDVRTYVASYAATLRQEQPQLVAEAVNVICDEKKLHRIGIDTGQPAVHLAPRLPASIDPLLWELRRKKEPDELALMRRAIDCTEAMYATARHMIEPGVAELDVFNALHAAAVNVVGEPLSAVLGNDYACGSAGGPARGGHVAAAGELYVLDLGPAYRGYFADNARTISVDRNPTDAQQRAADAIIDVFPMIESIARPGVRCRELYMRVDEHLTRRIGRGLCHHLGHGVGLEPHEYPHLNPAWDDVLIEGEIFTAEPGLYGPELRGGIRIENQYVVTADGVRNLTPFPTGLT